MKYFALSLLLAATPVQDGPKVEGGVVVLTRAEAEMIVMQLQMRDRRIDELEAVLEKAKAVVGWCI